MDRAKQSFHKERQGQLMLPGMPDARNLRELLITYVAKPTKTTEDVPVIVIEDPDQLELRL